MQKQRAHTFTRCVNKENKLHRHPTTLCSGNCQWRDFTQDKKLKKCHLHCILTNTVPLLPVQKMVKFCSKQFCKAMHQVFHLEMGMLSAK